MKPAISLFAILSISIASCSTHTDLDRARRDILSLHDAQRKAHMQKDIDLLLRDSLFDYIEVNRGLIKRPGRAESVARFKTYFDAVDFVQWDDITPPVISFSDDATMATTVVNKIVVTKNKSAGNRLDTAYYAWLAVYKKYNGQWQLHRMGSTNK